ncbi:TRAP transporter small permease [Acuticoccus sediminis]|uniref:TRAP transporter small permease protein n=1 Tax=Acuticoccus sediminis TaxID=2184697 RepID=A0A8B2NYX2_9HYPH|nr:TRAP transporter small permease [Acuticoccus sediminis]RAI01008.1 TRAP transporter small permease [Acuticoccus sediminis]
MRRTLTAVSEAFAIVGGLIVVAAIIVTVVAVVAARLGSPILGHNEIVELLVGVAIAFFLPWCQMRGANVVVDFFTARFPDKAKAGLDALMSALFALVVAVLAWRLIVGGIDAYNRGRTSMFLLLPQWWGYAPAALAMALWSLVCLATAVESALGLKPRSDHQIATDEIQ